MATLHWDLPNDVVDQGAAVTARLLLDCGALDFGAAQVDLYIPSASFSGVTLTAPSWLQTSDHFEASNTDDEYHVDVAAAQAMTGDIELCRLDCVASGARGLSHYLGATLVDAVDADVLPLASDEADVYVRINAGALGVRTTALPDAEAGIAYGAALQAEGGQPPYAWSLVSSDLPSQLVVSSDGIVAGTPPTRSTHSLVARVTDAAGATAQHTVSLRILASRPSILTDALAAGSQGKAYVQNLTSSGGEGAVTWEADGLPPGLSVTGTRISGTIDDTRAANALYEVTLRITDQAPRPRTTEQTLSLVVLPGRLIEQTVNKPQLIAAAPDLLLAEYDVTIDASAFMRQDDDTRAVLQDAMDDIIAEIVNLTLADGPLGGVPTRGDPLNPDPMPRGDPTGGTQPGVVDPSPLDDPPGTGNMTAHDAIEHLLQQYKDLNRMQSGAVVTAYYADVYIDDHHVCSVRKGIMPNRTKGATALSSLRARSRPSARSRAFREAQREDRRDILDWTRKKIHAYFFGGTQPPTITPMQTDIDAAIKRLRELLRGLDLTVNPPTSDDGTGRCSIILTPGAHRLRASWNIVTIFQEGSVLGAAEAASTQTTVSIGFKAQNPDQWPRLDGQLTRSYRGSRSGDVDELVQFPNSAVDLLVQDGDTNSLRLLAATGKPDQPFTPMSFSVQPGRAIRSMVAGAADAIGRSSVVMLTSAGQRGAWNDGPAGFKTVDYTLSLAEVAPPQFGRVPADGYASVLALEEAQLVEVSGFRSGNTFDTTPTLRRYDLAPSALGDPATSLVRLNDDGSRLGISFRLQGETQAYQLQGQQLTLVGGLAGLSQPSGGVLPVATRRGTFIPDTELLVQAQRQAQVLHVARFNSAGTDLVTLGQVRFPLEIDDAVAGPAGDGVAVHTLGENVWLVWWLDLNAAPRVLPVWLDGGVASIASSGAVLAAALPGQNKVVVLLKE